MKAEIIKGGAHKDERGTIIYNNLFNALGVKRVYMMQNVNTELVRGWQGHKIEKRWFSAVVGSFEIQLAKISDFETFEKSPTIQNFTLSSGTFDILCVPEGHVSAIKAKENNAQLLIFSDYLVGEVDDEYRFPLDFINNLSSIVK